MIMPRPAKISTAFPSVSETAKRLGVSKSETRVLSDLAERSRKTGEFAIPGIGRISGKKVVKFRVSKAVKNALGRLEKNQ